jgi:phospholipase C
MRVGEQYIKDIYEALRASPQWNQTLLVITYDEHGGFFDHVTPPPATPPGDGEASYPAEVSGGERWGSGIV